MNEFGIEVGTMTTVHAYTSPQMFLDGPVKGGNLRALLVQLLTILSHILLVLRKQFGYINP